MGRFSRFALAGALILMAAPGAAIAAGPVDWAVDVLWWFQDFDVDFSGSGIEADAGDLAYRSEAWIRGRLGVHAGQHVTDPDDRNSDGKVEYTNLDVTWRVFSAGPRHYLALGGGWERIDFGGQDTSGARVSAWGRLGTVYGRYAWMPSLDDFDHGSRSLRDVEGREWEVGLNFDLFAVFHVIVGYRSSILEFEVDRPGVSGSGKSESSGWIAGIGTHF